jgi:hypothetical protein
MMKRCLPLLVFFFVFSVLYGQAVRLGGDSGSANLVPQLDSAVKGLGAEINQKLTVEKVRTISLGQWNYRDSIPALSSYWAAQLAEELTNIQGRTFSLVSGGQTGADWIVSGEIIEAANIIRVYTRLVRSSDNSAAAVFHADFDRDQNIAEMLAGGGGRGGSERSSFVARDAYEPDSMENPLQVEIAGSSSGPLLNHPLHSGDDEDFFLLVPDKDGALVMETTGNTDTYMEFYEAGANRLLADNDDGGSGGNARIRYTVRAGGRYIAKVRGYEGETGSYAFRAYLVEPDTD